MSSIVLRRTASAPRLLVLLVVGIGLALTARGYLQVADTDYSIQTARAMVLKQSLAVPLHQAGATIVGEGGYAYSKYGLGYPLLLLPAVATALLLEVAGVATFSMGAGALVSATVLILSLGFSDKLFSLFRIVLPDRIAFVLAVGVMFGSFLGRYATSDFSEMIQAYFILGAFGEGVVQRPSWTKCGAMLSAAVLMKAIWVVFVPLLLFAVIVGSGPEPRLRLRSAAQFLWPLTFVSLLLLVANNARFGNPLEFGYGAEATFWRPNLAPRVAVALVISPEEGVVYFAPFLIGLMFFVRWPALLRDRRGLVFLAGFAEVLAIAACWYDWRGGWSWGPRLLVPGLPLVAVAMARNLRDLSRPGRLALSITAVASGLLLFGGQLIRSDYIDSVRTRTAQWDSYGVLDPGPVIAWRIVLQKMRGADEVYEARLFGLASGDEFSFEKRESFVGFDVWWDHLSRAAGLPILSLCGKFAIAGWALVASTMVLMVGGTRFGRFRWIGT